MQMACDLNPSKVNRFFGWIIPPFLICVMGFTTWVYIVLICINYLIMHVTLLVIFSILLCMVTLSFTRIIFTPPGYVPRFKDLKLSSSNDVGLRTHIVNQMKTFCLYDAYVCENDGFPRWCAVCEVYKPDRAHHCSEVQRCVLKLDHFCPWVGGNGRVPGPWIGILALASFFTLFLGPFTSIHIFYILRNSTTIESINFYARIYLLNVLYETEKSGVKRANVTTKPGYHPWDLGWKMNWRSVMGKHWWDWFFPFTGSPGSGYHFDYNSELLDELKIMAKQSKVVSKYLSSDKSVTTLNLQSECSGVNSQYGFCTDGVLTSSTNS
ncbi:unnamed protein product [Pneumocystis jirovecii]|uniref:Palmitoyltransferase n=1 Tax=Pneumocystis jirovecii TaxID=42068 RepID=L0PCE5_PNEJI|nr:unnamed protein product [Pneumocystis jirovecii]